MRAIKLIRRRDKVVHECDSICRAEQARARFDRELLPLVPPRLPF